MAKLHELLAVDQSVKGQMETKRKDLIDTLKKDQHKHFVGKTITFKPNAEGEEPRVEQQQELQTTVGEELEWFGDAMVSALDVGHQVDVGNTIAKADVVLEDGTIILKDVPTTSLMQIAHRLNDLAELLKTIPTLDMAQGFKVDQNMSRDGYSVYKAVDVVKNRTEKVQEPLVLYPHSDMHPAQTQLISRDKVIGTILTQEWSGLITSAEKSAMLDRVEDLTRAVKKARSRANEIELDVKGNRVGERLINFVLYNEK